MIRIYHKQADRDAKDQSFNDWNEVASSYASSKINAEPEEIYNYATNYLSTFGTGNDYAVMEVKVTIDGRLAYHANRPNRVNNPVIWINAFERPTIIKKTPLEI